MNSGEIIFICEKCLSPIAQEDIYYLGLYFKVFEVLWIMLINYPYMFKFVANLEKIIIMNEYFF